MVNLVNKLGENGIYTLLDFHQDLISEKFCGDGVPVWLIDEIRGYKTFPFPTGKKIPLNASGEPSWDDCDHQKWGKYYFTYDVGQVFNELYDTRSYLHKKYVKYWQKLAETFRGNPYIVAYELINEPFVGNAIRNPFLLMPTVADRFKFQHFYDNVVSSIRQVDPDTNICFEPITFDFAFNSGFSHPPGGKMYKNKSILCYHFESPPVKPANQSLKTMNAKLRDMKRLGIPVLMTEFGGNKIVKQFVEDHIQSYFYWQYKNFGKNWGSNGKLTFTDPKEEGGLGLVNPNGTINDAEVPGVARTILQKTAGHLIEMIYRVETGHFSAVYEATPGGISELYMSRNRIYKNGYTIDAFPREDIYFT